MITNHCTCLTRRKRPDRKFARCFVHVEQRLHHVVYQSSVGQGHQRMPSTESVPCRERRIRGLPLRSHRYAVVMTTILIVEVIGTVGHHQRMIPGSIEISPLCFRTTFHIHNREFLLPSRFRLLAFGLEIKVRHVVQQVLAGILYADNGKPHLGYYFPFLSEVGHRLHSVYLLQLLNGLRELKDEINVLIVHPTTGTAHPHQFIVGSLLHFRFVDEVIRIQNMCQIYNHRSILLVQIRITVHAGKSTGCEFHLDLFICQGHGIIARTGLFRIVRESSWQEDVPLPFCTDRLCSGAKQHIAQVLTSRTAQVGMRETKDGRIRIMIARAGIPVTPTGIWTQLHSPEGSRRPRVSMSVETCPDEGIYIINRCFLRRGTCT